MRAFDWFWGGDMQVCFPSAKLRCSVVPLRAHIWDWPRQLDAVLL